MLRAAREFLQSIVDPPGAAAPEHHTLELAAAVLMVEVMRAQPTLHEAERLAVASFLRYRFGMTPGEGARLTELAQEVSRSANDFHAFTSRTVHSIPLSLRDAHWKESCLGPCRSFRDAL